MANREPLKDEKRTLSGTQTAVPDASPDRYKVTRLDKPKKGNQINGRGMNAFLDYAMHDLHLTSKAATQRWNRDKEMGDILYESALTLMNFMKENYSNYTVEEAVYTLLGE